jgi:hypothetical protein
MTTLGRRVRWLLPAALCALAAHAAVYGTFTPADGIHGYLGWYQPLVAALSLAAAAGLLGLVLAARLGRGRRLAGAVRGFLPREEGRGTALPTIRLGRGALVVFFLQETLERSISSRSFEPASLRPSTWSLVLLVAILCAALLVLAGRGGIRLVLRAAAWRIRRLRRDPAPAPEREWAPRRRSPLALRQGLRAPPLLAG